MHHAKLRDAFRPYRGKTLSNSEMKAIVAKRFPEIIETDTFRPNDHAAGNKGACPCSLKPRTGEPGPDSARLFDWVNPESKSLRRYFIRDADDDWSSNATHPNGGNVARSRTVVPLDENNDTTDARISAEYWKDKRLFASLEVLHKNPRRRGVAGWYSLEMLRKAGAGGMSYAEWQARLPKNIKNAEGTRHHHLRWDHERGRIAITKDQGQITPYPFDDLLSDIKRIELDTNIPNSTTKQALIDARRGQGRFRAALMKRWGDACAVTGIRQSQLLRASHMKKWSTSDNKERLDPCNGLLISANIDALFDKHVVSFMPDGQMIVSEVVSEHTKKALGLPMSLRLRLNDSEKAFLDHHRSIFYSEWQLRVRLQPTASDSREMAAISPMPP